MTPWIAPLVALGLGLIVGSFLNVVIARLPRMLEQRWREDCQDTLAPLGAGVAGGSGVGPGGSDDPVPRRLGLARPASHCPQCLAPIRWRDNLPVLGFLLLRGRCRDCARAIPWRYPWVEGMTGCWFALTCWVWGPSLTALCWAAWGAVLIALAFIDAEHQLLPDDLTLPLCWAGLLTSTLGWIAVDPISAVWGAAIGYLLLWGVAWVYAQLRGLEGMGQGDFKLLAALGAWLGWQNLSLLLLIACLLGIAHGLLRSREQRAASPHFAFGPSLCLAAVTVVLWGRGQAVWLVF